MIKITIAILSVLFILFLQLTVIHYLGSATPQTSAPTPTALELELELAPHPTISEGIRNKAQ